MVHCLLNRSVAIAATALLLSAAMPLLPFVQAAESRILGPLTSQQEVYAGVQLDGVIQHQYPATQNIAMQQYVSTIGRRLAANTYKNYPFNYVVLADTRRADAFSAPGGFIYITAGLVNMLENESQLAAILAHETAHVMQHHMTMKLRYEATNELAYVLGHRTMVSPENSQLQSLSRSVMSPRFSPEEDYEADLLALRLMAHSGFNPQGMVQLVDKLNQLEAAGVYIPFTQSHPVSDSRARLLEEFIVRNGLEAPHQVVDTRWFHQVVP